MEREGDRQLGGEGERDAGHGRAGRVLLVNLLDGNEEILTVGSDRRGGAVDEPDRIPLYLVTGDVAGEVDVVEDDQKARRVVAEEADVGGQWVGRGEVPDGAIAHHLNLGRHNQLAKTTNHP